MQNNQTLSYKSTADGKNASQGKVGTTTTTEKSPKSDATTTSKGEESSSNQVLKSSDKTETAPSTKTEEKTEVRLNKMQIATDIYKRMRKTKGVTRKEIIEQFVAEANLSKAGAATYYSLIKAKVK